MSDEFRTLLKKIGSGTHTGKDLSRSEAATATRLMLTQAATPAQIGAFMIAHRIKRPTPEELAGMMDAYDQLGERLEPITSQNPVIVFNSPYDGRSRTAPITPMTALVLATFSCPAVMHGGDCMPTKYGVPLIEVWQALGVDWTQLTLAATQQIFQQTHLGFVYQPRDFPLAHALTPYRDQIGKRPPTATVELMWSPYAGFAHVVSGFVHPPTEDRTRMAYSMRGQPFYATVKGLEGSCDLPRDRTAIIGISQPDGKFERLLLSPRDYNMAGENPPFTTMADLTQAMQATLSGEQTEFTKSVVWNSGFYLWRCGVYMSVAEGISHAQEALATGKVQAKLDELKAAIASHTSTVQV